MLTPLKAALTGGTTHTTKFEFFFYHQKLGIEVTKQENIIPRPVVVKIVIFFCHYKRQQQTFFFTK
jgi:hypothetical protein